jgi:hypothetical protein
MHLSKHSKISTVATLSLAGMALATGPTFTGYVTGSYSKDLNNPANDSNSTFNDYGGKEASFLLNAAHLTVNGGDSSGATYTIDLDAGTDGTHNTGTMQTGTGWAFDIQQAFVTIPFGKSPLSLTGGKFYTSEGIEVANSSADPTVTRGLLYGQSEPVAHTGATVNLKANDQISASVGAINGWDAWTISPADGNPMVYGKLALSYGNPFSGTVSAYYGPYSGRNDLMSFDLTGLNKSIGNLDLNFQANYESEAKGGAIVSGTTKDLSRLGFGLQPLYHMGAGQIGLRYEYLSVDSGSGTKLSINSISVAPGCKLTQNSLLRIEYRIDLASEAIFESDKVGSGKKNDQVVTAEINYTF